MSQDAIPLSAPTQQEDKARCTHFFLGVAGFGGSKFKEDSGEQIGCLSNPLSCLSLKLLFLLINGALGPF